MKKFLFFAVIAAMVFTACRTIETPIAPANPIEEAFLAAIQRHRGDLVMTGATRYTVASGDTLVNIARTFYDDGFFYPVIMLASSNVVLDPDRIEPGMVLTVPDLQRNLNNARARASLRSFMLEIAEVEDSRARGGTANGIRDRANAL